MANNARERLLKVYRREIGKYLDMVMNARLGDYMLKAEDNRA
jgi:hypothetical protein